MFIDRGMDEEDVVHIYNGILLSHKKWNNAFCSNMDGPRDIHTKWSKSDRERQIPYVVVVQLLSRIQLFATPWTAAHQTSLSITNSPSLLKLMSIELVMPSNHLLLCRPLLLLPPIPPSIRSFLMSQLFTSGDKVLELQIQHQTS